MLNNIEKRSGRDRRSGIDRRKASFADLADTNDIDRRARKNDRRVPLERREGYTPLNRWSSTFLGIDIDALARSNQETGKSKGGIISFST